jgi:hypothetical protein
LTDPIFLDLSKNLKSTQQKSELWETKRDFFHFTFI